MRLYFQNLIIILSYFLIIIIFPSAAISQERLIKSGDALEILISDNEQLCQTVLVQQDGTIDYPTIQGFPIDGLSLKRFQEILTAQLSRYMQTTPLIFVKFSHNYPIRVTVLGRVANPGLYPILNSSTLQGAITAAGGFLSGAELSKIKIIHANNGTITNNNEIVNLERFYVNGDPTILPDLKDGDTVVIPGNPLMTKVTILGNVLNPGNYDIYFKNSLLDALFLAGGLKKDANTKKIMLISPSKNMKMEFSLDIKELEKPGNLKSVPEVNPGDIIFVPGRMLTWSKFMNFARDISVFATLIYLIQRSQTGR